MIILLKYSRKLNVKMYRIYQKNAPIFNNQDTFLSSYNKSTLFSSSSSSWEFTQTMSTSIDPYPLFVQHFTNYVEYILLEFLNSKQFAKGYERMIREILRKSGYFIII